MMIMRIFHLPWDTIHGPMHNLTGRLEILTPVLDQVIGLSNVGGIISYETLTIRFFPITGPSQWISINGLKLSKCIIL